MSLHQVNGLYIRGSDIHDRGVFCATDLLEGSVIEVAPVLILRNTPIELLDKTDLYDYYFIWGEDERLPALVMGNGSIYNHSSDANATFAMDTENRVMVFTALRDIPAGTEITINYHEGQPDKPLWFDIVDPGHEG